MEGLNIFAIAVRNTRKRGILLNLMIILTVFSAIGTIFTASMLLKGVKKSMRAKVRSISADFIVMPRSIATNARDIFTGQIDSMSGNALIDEYLDISLLPELAKVEGVQRVSPMLFFSIWGEDGGGACCGKFSNVYLLGFDPATDFTVRRLSKNKYVVKEPFADDEIFIGHYHSFPMIDYAMTRIGQVYGYSQKAVGMLKKTGTGLDWSFFLPLPGIYAMIKAGFPEIISAQAAERFKKINEGKISILLVKMDPLAGNPTTVGTSIKKAVPGAVVASTAEILTTRAQRQLYNTSKNLIYLGLMGLAGSVLFVGVMFSLGINARKREIGLLRAAGFRGASVFKLVLCESAVLTSLGGLLGLLAGTGLLFYLGDYFYKIMGMYYVWPSPYFTGALILTCLTGSLATGVLGALYPAVRCRTIASLEAVPTGQ